MASSVLALCVLVEVAHAMSPSNDDAHRPALALDPAALDDDGVRREEGERRDAVSGGERSMVCRDDGHNVAAPAPLGAACDVRTFQSPARPSGIFACTSRSTPIVRFYPVPACGLQGGLSLVARSNSVDLHRGRENERARRQPVIGDGIDNVLGGHDAD